MRRTRKYQTEDENRSSIKVYCKYCGHTNSIPAFTDKKLCGWCRRLISNTSPAHFKYKLRNMLKKEDEKDGKKN